MFKHINAALLALLITASCSTHTQTLSKTTLAGLCVSVASIMCSYDSIVTASQSYNSQNQQDLQLTSLAKNNNVLSYISSKQTTPKDVYISVDIEADGFTPCDGNMISLAAVATDLDLNILGYFEVNIKPHIESNQIVMNDFWLKNPKQYARTKVNAVEPATAMAEYVAWLRAVNTGKSLAMMALPASYDKMWTHIYTVTFNGKDWTELVGIGAIDIESLIMMYKKQSNYHSISAQKDVKEFKQEGINRSHCPLDDAIMQMVIGVNLLRHAHNLAPKFISQKVLDTILNTSTDKFGNA